MTPRDLQILLSRREIVGCNMFLLLALLLWCTRAEEIWKQKTGGLELVLNTNSGSFHIEIDGRTWLSSAAVALHYNHTYYLSTSAEYPNDEVQPLQLQGSENGEGGDSLGFFKFSLLR
jgi:hypothetical protein